MILICGSCYTLSFFLRRSWIKLASSFFSFRPLLTVFNIELCWLFHSIIVNLIIFSCKSFHFLHFIWALTVFDSCVLTEFSKRVCLFDALSAKQCFTSNAIFVIFIIFKTSLTFFWNFWFLSISLCFWLLFHCYISQIDGVLIEFSFAFNVMLRSIASLACKLEAASITNQLTHLVTGRTFVLLSLMPSWSFEQTFVFFGVIWRIFRFRMVIHI